MIYVWGRGGVGRHDMWEDIICVWGGVGRHDMCMGEGWEDMICVWGRGGKT